MNFDTLLLHPLTVHFPIALCFFEFFILALAKFKKNTDYLPFARLTFQVLAVCLTVTLATGWKDAGGSFADLFEGGVQPHFYSACFFSALVLARLALWKKFYPGHARCLGVQLAGSALMIAAAAVTGYWGGELVYS